MVAAIEPLLVRARDAAKALALSERTLWTLAQRGEIPRVLAGRAVLYDPADLRAWIEKKKTKNTPVGLVVTTSSC